MRRNGVPAELTNYVKTLYANNKCHYRGEGKAKLLYGILSGIIQGCPLSGSVFVIVVDPFLRLLRKSLLDSTNRAFADDIATIVQKLEELQILKVNSDLFRDIPGLDLKIKKCCLIPLGHDPTAEWLKKVSKAIAHIVSKWANFAVAPSAEYLGIIIGPRLTDSSWTPTNLL